MKKLFVLLIAAAVATGASAGVKISKDLTKVNIKEAKANALTRVSKTIKKGDLNVMPGTPLQAFNEFTRNANNHAMRDGGSIVWDFESEDQINDWTMLDNDGDGNGWQYIYDEGNVAHSGHGVMTSFSYDNPTYTALTPDNWLISPVVTLTGKLGFYYAGQDPSYAAEVFAVYVMLPGQDPIKISEDITASSNYQAFEYELTDYEGMEGQIAIRHYNVTDMFRLNIDDVTIGEFEPGEEPQPEIPEIITEVPETCELYTFFRNSATIYSSFFGIGGGQTDGKLTVALDTNGDAYIQNPMWYYDTNDAWVKGTYDEATGIITIPVGQYLNYYAEDGYGIILGWGRTYVYEDGVDEETGEPNYYLGTEILDANDMQFKIDGNSIYLLNSEGNMNAEFPENFVSTGMYAYWSDNEDFSAIEFANRDEEGNELPFGQIVNLVPAIPAMPTNVDWYDCGDESGFSRLTFTLPTTDVDGNMIDPEFLSYSIFTYSGGPVEIFNFDAATYGYDIAEDMTEIPYEIYNSGYDFSKSGVYFYRTNEGDNPLFTKGIGIRVYYTVDDEKNACDDIAWYGEGPGSTNVNEVNAGKTVANVRYFNVAGQEMAQPQGITIKVTTYTDGTSSAAKIMK